ncbi:TAXI family TRAP transporter solute-binding subunit [Spirabiliibacterium falconis]|uniref:TAXI family TRAP transporter solute-binding subunit n=1 Tax=Spirabiliibacterium falconis TaxID=572023 RepID=UPI001AADFCC2|nr:TAXI family TRAP transporter solute-binding subunit [Spirabiliibacterium falconis]MBE2895078.1 TAXI family TRAP transporter solute-binding subunit [Spirabiliibacterium falconis]
MKLVKHSFAALMGAFCVLGLSACDEKKENTVAQSAENPSTEQEGLQTKFVTIATGGASGPYNIIATTLAEIYAKDFNTNSKTQTTGASVENINLINQGKVEMAFVMSDVLSDAVNGTGNFSQKLDSVSEIAALYPNFVQIVTSGKTGIKTITDLKGKRVATGAQNSGVEVNARNLLAGFGITYDDINVDYLGYAEAADALKAGKIDAAFLTSGLPNSSLMELQQGFDLQLVSIPAEGAAKIAESKPYFTPMDIPANTYGNAEPVPTVAIKNALVVQTSMSTDDVYKLTKRFFKSLPQLVTAHQAAKGISVEGAQQGLVAPLHPGAEKYYAEVNAQ